ncbi:hypothetical protein D9601_10245 [Sphingomonas sp. MA1305]|uniref:hypothetical protein n=1 Tax=Sphingomonas sp. MA1305 TaxID=2479204 RepID=UPI0018DF0811|nr:hypothetical protein [Sphingomonas sp. MA1305]MBI0475731.1 hypothetical protein [Sphingomonas sp. MA1305]
MSHTDSNKPLAGFDPNSAIGDTAAIIRSAAAGQLTAQRHMRDMYTDAINTVDVDNPLAILFGVEMVPYARLCAAHGEAVDARCLAGALYFTFCASRSAGAEDRAQPLAGEAVAILEQLAERGDEVSALASLQLVSRNPTAGEIAKRLLQGGN